MAIYLPDHRFHTAALREVGAPPNYLVAPDKSFFGNAFAGGHLFNQDDRTDLKSKSRGTLSGDISHKSGRHITIGRTVTQGSLDTSVNSANLEAKCAILFKVRLTGTVEDYQHFYFWENSGATATRCHLLNSGRLKMYWDGSAQTWITSSFTGLDWQDGNWETFLIQWDNAASVKQVFYKNQKQTDTTAWTAGTTASNNVMLFSNDGSYSWEGDCEFFYFFSGINFSDDKARDLLIAPHQFLIPTIDDPLFTGSESASIVPQATHHYRANSR